MAISPNTPNTQTAPTPSVVLRGLLAEAEMLPARDGYPEGARVAILCGSTVVELYGATVRSLVGTAPGTPVQVLADVRAERARVEGRDRPQTLFRFRARKVQVER